MSIDILDTFLSFFVVFCKRISGPAFQFFSTRLIFFQPTSEQNELLFIIFRRGCEIFGPVFISTRSNIFKLFLFKMDCLLLYFDMVMKILDRYFKFFNTFIIFQPASL